MLLDSMACALEGKVACGQVLSTFLIELLTAIQTVLILINMKTGASEKRLVQALKAVADPTRLKILRLLKQKGCCSIGKSEGMCACDIEERIKLSQPTISHHMGILTKAGLVHAQKEGLWMWYQRDEEGLKELEQSLSSSI